MRRFRSIRSKNFFSTAAILLVSFIVLSTAFSAFSYGYTMRDKRRSMQSAAMEVTRIVSAYNTEMELSELELRMTISGIANIAGCHILVCTPDGTAVSCSDREFNCGHLGKRLPESITSELISGGEYTGITTLDGVFDWDRYVVAEPVYAVDGGGIVSFLVMSMDEASMVMIWRRFSTIFFTATACVLLVAFVISGITSERMTRPINEIAAAADQFARGNYTIRVGETGGKDEISELADAFNTMAGAIENQERQRREFIANVSHELKTPMTTITGFADGILDGTIPKEQHEKYLSAISSETKRLSRLVRNMLETSRLQAMDRTEVLKKRFDITEVVGMTLLGLEKKITDHGLDVDARLPEDRILVRGEQDAITQVVYNLLDNAVKFASPGSVLRLDLYKQENKVYVSVENTGETIPEEELPQIFARFHKADKSRGLNPDGVGLGLYIVKTILDNHGEDIFVTSRDGVTRFTFTLTVA